MERKKEKNIEVKEGTYLEVVHGRRNNIHDVIELEQTQEGRQDQYEAEEDEEYIQEQDENYEQRQEYQEYGEEQEEVEEEDQQQNENMQEGNRRELKRGSGRPKIVRSGMVGRPRKEYKMVEVEAFENNDNECSAVAEIPLKEALNGEHANQWKKAINDEILSMIKNETWQIGDLPKGRKEIGFKLVLTNKYNLDGSIERRKARLVAKGCSQTYGVDYQETFAPVVRMKSVRLIMALAAEFDLHVHQLDIKTAYLNGELEENIYETSRWFRRQFERNIGR